MRSMRFVALTMLVLLSFGLQTSVYAADTSAYKLALSFNDGQLWTINPDGTNAAEITQDSVDTQGLVASPDGKYLAYYVQSHWDSVIYLTYHVVVVLNIATGQEQRITGQEAIGDVSWSPDSQQLVFAVLARNQDASTHYELDVINRDSSGRTKIAEMDGYMLGPSWSPDGQHILYSNQTSEEGYQIFVMDVDGSNQHIVMRIDSCFICDRPRWTPDNQHIVYYKHPDLFIMDADGQHLRQLTDFAQVYNVIAVFHDRYGNPSYAISPDSQTLYYTMGYPLQIVKLDLGENGWANRTVLYDDQAHIIGGNLLSPDGKLLFFNTDSADGNLLSSLDLATGEVRVLANNVSQTVFITAS